MWRFVAEITSISASTSAEGEGSLRDMTASGTLARVLFDEAHSEAWTIRPELARTMQPAHPGDASYARAADALSSRDFAVAPNVDRPLTAETLRDCEVLVIAHPSDPAWERTTGTGSP